MNTGADFFGWLVAVAVATLLTGVIGALVGRVSETADISQSDAERQAGTIGIVAAVVLVLVVGSATTPAGTSPAGCRASTEPVRASACG